MRIDNPQDWTDAVGRLHMDCVFARTDRTSAIFADEHASILIDLLWSHPVTRGMMVARVGMTEFLSAASIPDAEA